MHEKLHIILFKRNARFIFVSNVPSAHYYLEMYKNNSKMFHFYIFVCYTYKFCLYSSNNNKSALLVSVLSYKSDKVLKLFFFANSSMNLIYWWILFLCEHITFKCSVASERPDVSEKKVKQFPWSMLKISGILKNADRISCLINKLWFYVFYEPFLIDFRMKKCSCKRMKAI